MCRMLVRVALSLAILAACDGFSYKECDTDNNDEGGPLFRVDSANISPTVVQIPGAITPTVQVTVLRSFTGKIRVDLTITKRIKGFDRKIPCVLNKGSCSYDFCDIFEHEDDQCPVKYLKGSLICSCPVSAGIYVVKDKTFQIPKFTGRLRNLNSGDFKVRVKLTREQTGKVLQCYDMTISTKA